MFIFGAGGHTKQCIDLFEIEGKIIEGIFDDNKTGYHYNYKIIDTINNANKYIDKNTELFIGIGDNNIREKIYRLYNEYNFLNCISNKANISKTTNLGKGNYIGQNVSILSDVIIGNFNILNENCIIPHDCIIGNYNHISILSTLGGNVKIGDYNLLGLNSTVIPNITIGNNNIIGAGSVILKNIGNNLKFVGNPAKIK
jgi:sugar O-acyltransferase (sialic acid O-acetyltransferase NeuD family)